MSSNELGSEMLPDWVSNIQEKYDEYKEPTLHVSTLNLLRVISRSLKQDLRAFVTAIEIIEEYIRAKRGTQINSPTLVALCSVFMARQTYQYNEVVLCEVDILSTLKSYVPMSNKVDDLTTFIYKFEKDTRIRADVMPICMDVMEMLYLTRRRWFYRMKEIYSTNEDSSRAFRTLMRHRLFFPICILIFVFRKTNYKHCLDVDKILRDMSKKCNIHTDHFNAHIDLIDEIYSEKF
ncbi:unnamed protein product [Acanthoscelides obtectus]|uniref:Uncharacterized protein n=1 Tax=Acanthoscelides obtectus TaxID=200917 RepID=A0A9P0PEY5_ACAOB|nr:unnamed protein product [Acanthoscelides obtectus]CAK1643425.1 hypothetical protein AOBTE_LOCUS13526 [Acanthoscelides obtectus]